MKKLNFLSANKFLCFSSLNVLLSKFAIIITGLLLPIYFYHKVLCFMIRNYKSRKSKRSISSKGEAVLMREPERLDPAYAS